MLAILIWFREPIWSIITNSQSNQRVITVVEGQGATVEFGDYVYGFGYLPAGFPTVVKPTLVLTTKTLTTKLYEIAEGTVINDYGVEITVLEIHNNYIKIAVKQVAP